MEKTSINRGMIMCPNFPRTDPEAIWNYRVRTLTRITGQPRIDLMGSDQNLPEIGWTSARAAKLDSIDVPVSTRSSHTVSDIWNHTVRTLTFDTPIGGFVYTDPTETDILVDEISGNPPRYLEGYIDLSELDLGDTLIVRQYIRLPPYGFYVKYAEDTYSGPVDPPVIYVQTRPTLFGLKITAEQTSGGQRRLTLMFFRRRTA